uniref:Uncharacterized protein n=1 Tax=Octopus bimaculoides TaxID=37653 RepID=A0A0L8I053_OCTBM
MISYRLISILIPRSVFMVNFLLKSVTFMIRNLNMEGIGSSRKTTRFQCRGTTFRSMCL